MTGKRKKKNIEPTRDDWEKAKIQIDEFKKTLETVARDNELPFSVQDPDFQENWVYEKPYKEHQTRGICPSDMDTCPFSIGSRILFYEITDSGYYAPVNALVVGMFYNGFAYVKLTRAPIN